MGCALTRLKWKGYEFKISRVPARMNWTRNVEVSDKLSITAKQKRWCRVPWPLEYPAAVDTYVLEADWHFAKKAADDDDDSIQRG